MKNQRTDKRNIPARKENPEISQPSETNDMSLQIDLLGQVSKTCLHILCITGALLTIFIILYIRFETDPARIAAMLEVLITIAVALAVSSTAYIVAWAFRILMKGTPRKKDTSQKGKQNVE